MEERKWEEMTPEQRREALFEAWLSPQGIEFAGPDAEKAYRERVTRIKDAIELKKPDRVPVFPVIGFFPAFYAGMTAQDVMYDYEKLISAYKKYTLDFEPDAHGGAFNPSPGRIFEILDYQLYIWPGHGVSPNHSYQCLEEEYMRADEYDDLIRDPSNYFMSTYLPRVFKALEPLQKIPPLTGILEMYSAFSAVNFIPFGMPDVQEALQALMEAGNEAVKWIGYVGTHDKEVTAAGFPAFFGGGTKAPFDIIGDTLRGTRGMMMDIFRRPEKILEAVEALTPIAIKMGATAARNNGNPIVFMPLHKGADGFMSDEQFRRLYWPSLKEVMLGLVEQGCVPFLYAEGGYNSRLEVIKEFPAGKVLWGFDQTDMSKVKENLGGVACVGGNMPIDLLSVGKAEQVREYAKKLIETVGGDGGYIMMSGAVIDEAKPENVKAMIEATKEYGVY
ncbi:MAG: uroporphyrinogen decarboxylase family protein [Actinomycetota bacterium]|nr:uroporphyrinogen decarboxylase family protein [Actinomycetota bacterium]MDD5667053.1 uroporphyrinogen decarboxylase family protein [Actinomycetota bacterium]